MVSAASRNMRGVVIPWFSLEPATDFDVRANATAEKYSCQLASLLVLPGNESTNRCSFLDWRTI